MKNSVFVFFSLNKKLRFAKKLIPIFPLNEQKLTVFLLFTFFFVFENDQNLIHFDFVVVLPKLRDLFYLKQKGF